MLDCVNIHDLESWFLLSSNSWFRFRYNTELIRMLDCVNMHDLKSWFLLSSNSWFRFVYLNISSVGYAVKTEQRRRIKKKRR